MQETPSIQIDSISYFLPPVAESRPPIAYPYEVTFVHRKSGIYRDEVKDSLHRYLEDVATSEPLTSEEEVFLARRIKKGDLEARRKLVEANLLQNSLEDAIFAALNTLEEREREVIRLYFGLGGDAEMTLEEIGIRFRLTKERVRQIKEKAHRKLRHPTRGRKLVPYSDGS